VYRDLGEFRSGLHAVEEAGAQSQTRLKYCPKLYGNLWHGGDKGFGIGIFRSTEDSFSGANFYDLSPTHYRNSGGELRDHWETMGDKNQRK
jgi:hypothetical protein